MLLTNDNGDLQWRPTLKQERFLQIPLSVKEGFYAGAVNAGKSDVLLMYPIVHQWHRNPHFKGVFLRRTVKELSLEIIPRAITYLRPFGGIFKEAKGRFEFPSGALYYMNHVEYEKDVHNYDSMQINYLAFDELTSFTEWMYLYLTIERVRVDKNLEGILPAIVRSGSNPGNIGHQFVYRRFIKPYKQGGKILRGRGGIKRVFIPATIDDNPHASDIYKAELEALPDAEKKAKKYGDWEAYEGQVFDEFRDKHYPGEPDNAVHIVNGFDIPSWWPRICAIDWGYSAMCSIGWGAISPSKRLYVYRHQMFYGKKIEEWAPEVRYFVEKENPGDIVICHSANQHRGDPHTILEQVTDALGSVVRLGERDRVGGKALLHEFLRWKQKPIPLLEIGEFNNDFALSILRQRGQVDYQKYCNSFVPQADEIGLPKIQFFDSEDVKIICESIKACVYEKANKDGKKKEDVAEFNGDDPYDMLRMLVHAADSFFGVAVNEQNKLNKVNSVVVKLEETQDWTTYYRNMRKIENEELIKPIRRYHRSSRA